MMRTNSGSLDANDPRVGGRLVALSSNGEMALSQPNGRYLFAVNGPAQHILTGPTITHYDRDPDTHSVSITGNEPGLSGFDFRYTAGPPRAGPPGIPHAHITLPAGLPRAL
jgi:hypothetical protein